MTFIPFKQPCLTLLYSEPALPLIDGFTLAKLIASVDGTPHTENILVNIQVQDGTKLLADLSYDNHSVKIVGGAMRLPNEVISKTIDSTQWTPVVKAKLREHHAQIVLTYTGSNIDPLEKIIVLYKVAYALKTPTLLGLVNEPSWTSHPVKDTLDTTRIRAYRESIPFILWFGYLKVPVSDTIFWLVTRGQHTLGIPDFATLCTPAINPADVLNNFFNVAYYLLASKAQTVPGDTLTIGDTSVQLRINEMPDLPELKPLGIDPAGLLLLEAITPDEINKKIF